MVCLSQTSPKANGNFKEMSAVTFELPYAEGDTIQISLCIKSDDCPRAIAHTLVQQHGVPVYLEEHIENAIAEHQCRQEQVCGCREWNCMNLAGFSRILT